MRILGGQFRIDFDLEILEERLKTCLGSRISCLSSRGRFLSANNIMVDNLVDNTVHQVFETYTTIDITVELKYTGWKGGTWDIGCFRYRTCV
jgi:hypothetical protein